MKRFLHRFCVLAALLYTSGTLRAQIIYNDSFITGQTAWGNYSDDKTASSVQGGKYILTHKSTTYSFMGTGQLPIDETRDYSIETTVAHLSGDQTAPFGLAFAAKDVSNLYYFAISGNGYYMLTKQLNGAYNQIIPWTQSSSILPGQNVENKLRLEKHGGQLLLFINGQQVNSVPMVQPFGSAIGCVVFKAESVSFDYLTASYIAPVNQATVQTRTVTNTSLTETAYHTNFQTDDANGWAQNRADSASISLYSGQLNISRSAKTWYTSALSSPSTAVDMRRDFWIETEATHESGGQNFGYGLDFGSNGNKTFHFWVAATGFYFIGSSDNTGFNTIVPFTQTDLVNKGDNVANKLSIAHKNGQLYFYINGQQIETHRDLDFAGSRFGVSVAGPQGVGFSSLTLGYTDKPAIATNNDSGTVPEIFITSPEVTRGLKVVQASDMLHVAGIARDAAGIFSVKVNDVAAVVDAKGNFTADIPMAIGDNPLMVSALNNNMRKGTYTFHVVRNNISASTQQTITQTAGEGKFYALLVGEADYKDPNIPSLDGPVNDANNLAKALLANYTFSSENVTILKNPTRSELFKALENIANNAKPEDNVLIFYAGHGLYDQNRQQGYWFPSDAQISGRETWISNSDLIDYIKAIKSKHTLLISDACFSGSIFKTRAIEIAPKGIQELYKLPSRKAITSGTMVEVPDKSVFMEYLLKRLNENTDKFLPAEQLFASFKEAVSNNSPQVPQFGEIRDTGDEGGDFVFIKKD